MKRPAAVKPGPQPAKTQRQRGASIQGEAQCEPLPRRPRTFAVLMILFVLWLGALLGLYFKTVYPMRYPSTEATTRPGASALPNAPR